MESDRLEQAPDLSELLRAAASATPDHPALHDPLRSTRLTWRELDEAATRLASGLSRAGMIGGQRVLITIENRVEFVTVYLGVLRAQLIAVPINPAADVDEIERALTDSGARLALVSARTQPAVAEAAARLHESPQVIDVDTSAYAELLSGEPTEIPRLPDPEKLAALLYTSGTSGLPRAAMLTHRAFLADLRALAAIEAPLVQADDIVLGAVPLFHVYGLNAVLGSVIAQGATLLLVDRFDPEAVLDLIHDHRVSVVPVAPRVFSHWLSREGEAVPRLAERLAGVRLIVSGSAPLSAEAIEAFTQATGHSVQQGYGLTEAGPVVASTLVAQTRVPGSLGRALPGIEMALRDELGHEPEADDPGEVWIRGANLFSGYWPDADDGPHPDDDGWWPTGDLGFLDDGELTLVDRLDEVIVVSGFSVYPSEVEDVIAELPEVRGVAVFGVPDPDTGSAVSAWVCAPSAGAAALVPAIREHCLRRLARFKVPTRIEVVDQLPVTPTGQPQKGRLRHRAARQALEILP